MRRDPGPNRALLAVARALARGAEAAQRLEPVAVAGGRRRDRALGLAVHAGLYLAVLAAIAGFFSAAFGDATWAQAARIAIGVVLAVEGALLATDWGGARRLLLRRLYARSRPAATFVETLRWRAAGVALAGLGLVGVCVGLILAGQATAALT